MGTTALVLIVYVLAVMRLTRLITSDTVLDRVRVGIARMARDNDRSATNRAFWTVVSDFLACPWCVGFWLSVGGAVAPVLLLVWPWWTLAPLALACSQLVGMAAPLYTDDEIAFEPVLPS